MVLYAEAEGGGSNWMPYLGYDVSNGDRIVGALISSLKEYTGLKPTGSTGQRFYSWDRNSVTPEARYRIDLIINSWQAMEQRIISAMRRLDGDVGALIEKDTAERAESAEEGDGFYERLDTLTEEGDQERLLRLEAEEARPAGRVGEFVHSLNVNAARRIIDWSFDGPSGVAEDLDFFESGFEYVGEGPQFDAERRSQLAEFIALGWEAARGNLDPRDVDRALDVFLGGSRGEDTPSKQDQAIANHLNAALGNGASRFHRARTPDALVDFTDPVVARPIPPSIAGAGMGFTDTMWRLMDVAYDAQRIADPELRDLVDHCLAVQAEYQLQALLTNREMAKVVDASNQQFEYLKAKAAAEAAKEQGGSFWGFLGDVLGMVSAVTGVLAMIPVLTPICGPIALATATGAFGAHLVDAAIKGDWDAATFAGLAADALVLIPGIGATAKGLKAGATSMRAVGGLKVASRAAGRTFLAEVAGRGASEATKVFSYIGTRGAKAVGASTNAGKIAGKVMQGSVNLATQVPLAIEFATGSDLGDAKEAATGATLTANYVQTVGSWGAVGSAAKKGGTVTLSLLGRIVGRR
ncbi:HrpF/NolX family T3SS translocon protein [Streptomyces sp. NPDC002446]